MDTKQPLVSVCMITYNHSTFIKQAIEGVLSQKTNFDIEFVISNDASTDNTHQVIEHIISNHGTNCHIKYFNHKKNKGMMSNFSFTLGQCRSQYIALCEGDDYWIDPLKLQKQVDFLENNQEYSLCFHKIKILDQYGRLKDDFITSVPEQHESINDLALLGNYIHTPSVVFRNILSNLPLEFKKSPFGDYFLYMLLGEHGKLKYINDTMAVYRHNVGVLSKMSPKDILLKSIKLYSLMMVYFKDEELKKILLRKQVGVSNYYIKRIEKNYEKRLIYSYPIAVFFNFFKTLIRKIMSRIKLSKKNRNTFS